MRAGYALGLSYANVSQPVAEQHEELLYTFNGVFHHSVQLMLLDLRFSPPLPFALRGTALLLGLVAFLFSPRLSSAQTTKVLEDAHVEISFPKGWSVAKADIKATEELDDEATLEEAFASAQMGRCVDRVRQAYVAHPDGENDISVVVMEVDIYKLGLENSRACAMAAANRRIKSVEWEELPTYMRPHIEGAPPSPALPLGGSRTHGTAQLRKGEQWLDSYVAGLFFRPSFPKGTPQKRGAVYFTVFAPPAQSRQAQHALKKIHSMKRQLPVDCSGLKGLDAVLGGKNWTCKPGTLRSQDTKESKDNE